jgi:gluconate 2-dehydrogenase alpha chain
LREPRIQAEGGTRMGNDIPNLFIVGSSTHPSMSGFNPTLTIQALAYMSADAIVNRYKKHPGALL